MRLTAARIKYNLALPCSDSPTYVADTKKNVGDIRRAKKLEPKIKALKAQLIVEESK